MSGADTGSAAARCAGNFVKDHFFDELEKREPDLVQGCAHGTQERSEQPVPMVQHPYAIYGTNVGCGYYQAQSRGVVCRDHYGQQRADPGKLHAISLVSSNAMRGFNLGWR
eukprot:2204656-Rhodomonas_salina.1